MLHCGYALHEREIEKTVESSEYLYTSMVSRGKEDEKHLVKAVYLSG